jgi:hypothetical protein
MLQEESNLSFRHSDRNLGWAQVYEEIYETAVGKISESTQSELMRALAARWYWAGRDLSKLARTDEGILCYRRALHWNPMMFRAWREIAASGPSAWSATVSNADFSSILRRKAA